MSRRSPGVESGSEGQGGSRRWSAHSACDFDEEGRDQFGASDDAAIGLCPDSAFAFEEVGGASFGFMGSTDDPDPMKLFETLRIVEFDELDTLMTDLEAAVGLRN